MGRPLASSEGSEQKIGALAGVPTLGLDALGSASYGPEAALAILLPVGTAGLGYIGPISVVILALLAILYFSHRQTIAAYPDGGGSYTVAKFPRLCRILAADGYLPRALGQISHRLVYSAGILVLAGTAGTLLVGFGGITDRLIPLFAVGAFGAFTASQAGTLARTPVAQRPRGRPAPGSARAAGPPHHGHQPAVVPGRCRRRPRRNEQE